MRLPNIMRIAYFGQNKKGKRKDKPDKEDNKERMHTSSSPTSDSSQKIVPHDILSSSNDATEAKDEIRINPYEFFESDTWKQGTTKSLELVISEPPRDWLGDVKISSDSGISGISVGPIHGSYGIGQVSTSSSESLGNNSLKLARSTSFGTTSSSIVFADNTDTTVNQAPLRRYTNYDIYQETDAEVLDDAERKRRRRRTYHLAHINGNPFFHAMAKGAKYRTRKSSKSDDDEMEKQNLSDDENNDVDDSKRYST